MIPLYIIRQFLIGLSYSMYLWVAAAGLTLIFGVLGVLNFAHGSLYMIGGYLFYTYYMMLGIDFWESLLLSCASTALIGLIMERYALRYIYHLEVPFQLLLTFGIVLIFDDLVKIVWGPVFRTSTIPWILRGSVNILGIDYPVYNIFLIGIGVAIAALLAFLLRKTWWGRIIRAATSQKEMAAALGVNVPRLYTAVFVFGTILAALGGAFSTPIRTICPGLGIEIIAFCFIVTVIGGLGSFKGAFVGSLLIGLASAYGILFIPVVEVLIPYILMAAILILRPEGMFGRRV